jgi:hypothetical protein
MTDLNKAPFSAFQLQGTLATHSDTRRSHCGPPGAGGSVPGRWAIVLGSSWPVHDLRLHHNEVIDFGGQGFMGGIIAQSDRAKKVLLHGEALARFMPIAAVRSDYFVTSRRKRLRLRCGYWRAA